VTDEAWRDTNRAMWDERVPIHVGSEFYDVDAFRSHPDRIRPFEADEVGDVRGKSLVHLQCHFGLDALSWAHRGAKATGLDFSQPAIEAARRLAADLDIDADFVVSDVYGAVDALGGRQFDIVYTGLGAINWLPDISRWAQVVAALVKPGGFLYLSEFHPILWGFSYQDLTLERDYFEAEPFVDDEPGSYTDPGAVTVHNQAYEWQHTMGDIVTAIVDAGLTIEFLHEFPQTYYARWPFLVRTDVGREFPSGQPRLPLVFSLRARRS
jgi:SAM-dependent methyltransferase